MQLFGALASPYAARVVLFARLEGIDLDPGNRGLAGTAPTRAAMLASLVPR
jgi:hypothetical protein